MLNEEQKKRIILRLSEKGAIRACPRCGKQNFTLLDGIFNQTVQADIKNLRMGGTTLPAVVISCDNCGFLSQHSIGVLGLLDMFT